MRKRTLILAAALIATAIPAPAGAWGFTAHRYIMGRALELLPPELKPFFDRYRDEIVIRSIDPDLWRNAGWEEEPHHFINFGAREFGEYPFTALPREYGAALEKFGIATLTRTGMLPWRAEEMFGNLRRAFEAFKRGSLYGASDLILFSAVTGHYFQDAHQPFHASNNYDGQLSGNTGIHARFERDLVEKFLPRLTIKPPPPKAIAHPRDAAFDALLASFKLVDPILKADSEAIAGKDTYNSEYFETFLTKVKPMLEERLSSAISATAGLIIGAWEQAGRPTPALEGTRPPEKVKK